MPPEGPGRPGPLPWGHDGAPIPRGAAHAAYDIVFLDRDGTINVHGPGYVADPDRLVPLPGALAAVARLTRAGVRVVVVTNQRGLATGALTWAQWYAVDARLRALVTSAGGRVDAVLMCPHEAGTCRCRKPGPGLFEAALARAPWAAAERCAMVGDMPSDVAPAAGLGMRTALLGRDTPDLGVAVDVLLAGVLDGDGK